MSSFFLLLFIFLRFYVSERTTEKVTYTYLYSTPCNNYCFRYKPGTTIELFEAFRTLDVNNEGVLSADLVREILRGEFDDDVIDRVIKSVYDPILEAIPYDVWVNKLVVILQSAVKMSMLSCFEPKIRSIRYL